MNGYPGAGDRIVTEVTAWPGVEATTGSRGELSLRVGKREIGHLHGDHAAHFGLPKALFHDLHDRAQTPQRLQLYLTDRVRDPVHRELTARCDDLLE